METGGQRVQGISHLKTVQWEHEYVSEEQKEREQGGWVPDTTECYTCNDLLTSSFPECERNFCLAYVTVFLAFLLSTTLVNSNKCNYGSRWFTS